MNTDKRTCHSILEVPESLIDVGTGALLKLGPKPFLQTTNRFSSFTLLGWKSWNSVFLSPPSLPSPFLSHPPSFRVCVSLFDGLVSALCFPLSLHSAVQRRHGPEAGHQERGRHQGGVWAQGESDETFHRFDFDFCSILNIVSCMVRKHNTCHELCGHIHH